MSFHSTSAEPLPLGSIRALVSDVDGTLVTSEKLLSARTIEAVATLKQRGVRFSIVSSRPPRGLKRLVDELAVTEPFAAFNGGVLLTPAMSAIEEHVLPTIIARYAVNDLIARGLEVWVFSGANWYVGNGMSAHVAREKRALQFEPIVIADFEPALTRAAKIVGISDDLNLVERCEKKIGGSLAGGAEVVRSQSYALDITHPLANKGVALAAIAARMSVPLSAIAVIGDGGNDLSMFARGGLKVAMGNAAPRLKGAADCITADNDNDGFAEAIEHLFLRTATRASRP